MLGDAWKYIVILWVSLGLSQGLCPLSCFCTQDTVNCSNASFTTMPSELDQNVTTYLDLSFNEIVEVSIPSFKNLKFINFSNNIITKASFQHSKNLTKLDFSFNYISFLGNIDVRYLPALKTLNVSHNKNVFPRSMYSSSLEVLDLSFNDEITRFEHGLMDQVPKLSTFILSNNRLKVFPDLKSESLKKLSLENCSITHITRKHLESFPNLIYLNAANNRELKLSLDGYNCLKLEDVDFSKTGSSEISIRSLCNVRNLSFSYNTIINIRKETFESNPFLNHLNLSFNNIEEIEKDSFLKNTQIHVIDLSNNHISSVDWSIHLSEVIQFNASNNAINRIDNLKLSQAEIIDLSQNKIDLLEINISSNFPNVKILNFKSNLIEHVQQLTSKTLTNLILSYCQISILNENTFSGLTKLNYLDLDGNKLKRLNYKMLENIPNLIYIKLDHNAWSCNCESKQFKDLLIYLIVNHTLTSPSSLHCDSENTLWTDACVVKLPTSPKGMLNLNVVLGVGCFFMVAIAALAGIVYFKAKIFKSQDSPRPSHGAVNPPQRLMRSSSAETPRESVAESSVRSSLPPPSYEEALLLPPLSEVERMTRSRVSLSNIAQ